MTKWALDVFGRRGGSARGLQRAGFKVMVVDVKDFSDNYAGDDYAVGDGVQFIREHGHKFDAVHTGPPCQNQIAITKANRKRDGWTDDHVNLIPETRDALAKSLYSWIPCSIENGESEHLRPDVVLCGLAFGLPVLRHRYFELHGPREGVAAPPHVSHRGHLTIGWRHGCLRTLEPSVCPKHDRWCRGTVYGVYGKGGGKPSVADAQHALDIDWMTDIRDLNEAIPPAYTEYIGKQWMSFLNTRTVIT